MAAGPKTPQKTRADWGAAKAFYVALAPSERTFARVAREYRVSSLTVRKHAHADGWVEAAEHADRQAAARALVRAVKTREERTAAVLALTDLTVDRAHQQVEGGEAVRLADVPPLVKLTELLLGEATDRVALPEAQEMFGALMSRAVQAIREGWSVEQFLASMREVSAIGDEVAA